MILCKVTGTIVATQKKEQLKDKKILIVQPITLDGKALGRDLLALDTVGLILQMLAESNGTLSAFKATLPQYSIAKGKIELGKKSADEVLKALQGLHDGSGKINRDDGLRIDFTDHWVHLRKSNTEPIVRIIAEAKTASKATDLIERFRQASIQ